MERGGDEAGRDLSGLTHRVDDRLGHSSQSLLVQQLCLLLDGRDLALPHLRASRNGLERSEKRRGEGGWNALALVVMRWHFGASSRI